jgi:hypothetical protein
MSQFNHNLIITIIDRYGLELDDDQVEQVVAIWLQKYDLTWIIKAIVESLHRGRYKVISVDSILSGWQRAGKPSCKFTAEFEREILQDLPIRPTPTPPETAPSVDLQAAEVTTKAIVQPTVVDSKYLDPEESAPFQHHSHSVSVVQSTYSQAEAVETQADQQNLSMPQSPSLASSDPQSEQKPSRIVSQPAKFQLFNTLRSIVDPNYQPLVKFPPLDTPQLYPEVTLPRIVRFNLPIDNVSGGGY